MRIALALVGFALTPERTYSFVNEFSSLGVSLTPLSTFVDWIVCSGPITCFGSMYSVSARGAKLRKMKNVNISARCQLVLLVSELKP